MLRYGEFVFIKLNYKVCSEAEERVGCGKQRETTAPIKSLVKLQPWFLRLRWKTCLRQNCSLGFSACSEGPAFGQNTDSGREISAIILNDDYLCYKESKTPHNFFFLF